MTLAVALAAVALLRTPAQAYTEGSGAAGGEYGYGGSGYEGGSGSPAQPPSGSKRTKRVVEKARNPKLGRTVLTSTKGLTLYSLSAETNGRFICTKESGCLSIWHPLMVPAGVTPAGPVKLRTVERPEGGIQVTYRGRPLYRFGEDRRPGEANGQGLKDVGTWRAVTVAGR